MSLSINNIITVAFYTAPVAPVAPVAQVASYDMLYTNMQSFTSFDINETLQAPFNTTMPEFNTRRFG